jgi:hypothetical protein
LLWIVCVLFGLAGMVNLTAVLLAKPLGIAWFGLLSLVCFAAALGLWRRLNVARIGVTALLASVCVLLLLAYVRDPLGEAALRTVPPLGVDLLIISYLWFRRRHFKVPAERRPRFLSAQGVVAGALVVLVGGAFLLLMVVDDAPREFPLLTVEERVVPDDRNGFVALKALLDGRPAWEDEETRHLLEESSPEECDDPEVWYGAAGRVARQWEPWLKGIDAVLARPAFVPPQMGSLLQAGGVATQWLGPAREVARRLAIVSRARAHEGRLEESMRVGHQIVELGVRMSEGNNCLITHLVGIGLVAMGLEAMQQTAASDGPTVGLLRAEIGALDIEGRLKAGMVRSLGQEFAISMRLLADLRKPELLDSLTGTDELRRPSWAERLLRDSVPIIKVTMSRNVLGTVLTRSAERVQRYAPAVKDYSTGPFGVSYLTEEMNLFHFARNPVGDMIVMMLLPALDRSVDECHGQVAGARLTQVFLALRCYQLENGRLPGTLDELAPNYIPQVPVDPFTERPFGYEPEAGSPRIYSVGPDQKPDAPDAEKKDDIIIELGSAAAR